MSFSRVAEVIVGGAVGASITVKEVAPDDTLIGNFITAINQTNRAVGPASGGDPADRGIISNMSNGKVFFLASGDTAPGGGGPTIPSVYYIEVSDISNPGHKFYVKTDPGDGVSGGNSGNWIAGLFFPWHNFGGGFSTTGIMAEMTGAAGSGYKLEILIGTGGFIPAGGAWNIETPSTAPIGFNPAVAWGSVINDGPRNWQITDWLHQNFDPIDTLLP